MVHVTLSSQGALHPRRQPPALQRCPDPHACLLELCTCEVAVLGNLEAVELDDGQVWVVAHRHAAQEGLRHLLLERLLRVSPEEGLGF